MKRRNIRVRVDRTRRLSVIAMCAPWLAAPAFGQMDQEPTASVEEIVVTARKREESLKDVPVAATAFTAEALERNNVRTIADIAAMTPGLHINVDSATRAFIAIRGVGTTFLPNVQPGVGLFIDGVYQPNTSYLNNPTLNVERIEVLRGPQGTMYGKNTLGGAINIVTRKPSDVLEGSASVGYSWGDESTQAAMSLSGPLSDRVQARIAASTEEASGFFKNALIGGDAYPTETDSLGATLQWQVSDAAGFAISGYYLDILGGHASYSDVGSPRDYVTNIQLNVLNRAQMRYEGVNGKLTLDLPQIDSELSVIAAYDARDGRSVSDGDFMPLDLLASAASQDLRTRSAEVRLDTRFDDRLSLLLGAFASRRTSDEAKTSTFVPLALDSFSAGRVAEDSTALFGTLFWNIRPDLELSAGLRYDHEDLEFRSGIFAPDREFLADPDVRTGSEEFEPRLTLTKRWADTHMMYASIARGYRGGGANPSDAPADLLVYEGDSVWTYELGSKIELFDRRLYLSSALFYNDYRDYIGVNGVTRGRSGGLIGVNFNTGDVESYGLEVEFAARLTRAWAINGGVTLMRARITDQSGYVRAVGEPLGSDRLLYQPDWSFNLETAYEKPLPVGKLIFRGALVGKGERDAGAPIDAPEPALLEAYLLTNASIDYEHGRYRFSVYGSNLFDEKYFESYIEGSALADVGLPYTNLALLGAERRVGVRASVRF